MDISFDPAKRASNLLKHNLDLADAGVVFAGKTASKADDRMDYGEDRTITAGYFKGRCVVLVWTSRGASRRIISMRYAHAVEEENWF